MQLAHAARAEQQQQAGTGAYGSHSNVLGTPLSSSKCTAAAATGEASQPAEAAAAMPQSAALWAPWG